MQNKEQWIDEVLNSASGLQRQALPNKARDHIFKARNTRQIAISSNISLPKIVAAAAVIILINTLSIMHYRSKHENADKQTVYEVLEEQLSAGNEY